MASDSLQAVRAAPRTPAGGAGGKRRIRFAVAVAAILMTGVVLRLHYLHTLQVRLLMASADSIPNDPALLHYAVARGRSAYAEHCATCHGLALKGDRGLGVPNLTDRDWLYGSGRIGEIERIILYGIRSGHSKSQQMASMPAFATAHPYSRYTIEPLTRQEVDDVAALVYSFQHRDSVPREAVERGAVVWHGKGLCFDCHGDHATGNPAIGAPNLTDATWLAGDGSVGSITYSIQRGAAGVCPQWISRLPPATIRSIAVYVNASSNSPEARGHL